LAHFGATPDSWTGGRPQIEIGDPRDLDEFLLRLLEACDCIALPCFDLPLLALCLRVIVQDPARMRAAEREGIASQIRNFVRQAEHEQGHGQGRGVDRDEGLER
jgi:hypothetical protein